MTSNLDEKGLRSIVGEYDVFFIDIWGVLHNGLNLFQNSVEVLEKLEKNKKKYVLLTNAPRPNLTVVEYLSTAFTLEPGDLIATGTPEGVAATSRNWLKVDDVVKVTIEKLGFIENKVIAEPDSTASY